jgi:hypothetical protein
MMRIEFSCTPRIEEFVREIAANMVVLFNIPLEEAAGRINRFWRGNTVHDELDERILLREGAEYWAKTIYYGSAAMWWVSEDGLKPTPYP